MKKNLSELEKFTVMENRTEQNDGTSMQWSRKLQQKLNNPGIKAKAKGKKTF